MLHIVLQLDEQKLAHIYMYMYMYIPRQIFSTSPLEPQAERRQFRTARWRECCSQSPDSSCWLKWIIMLVSIYITYHWLFMRLKKFVHFGQKKGNLWILFMRVALRRVWLSYCR